MKASGIAAGGLRVMTSRIKAGVYVLAAIGAIATVRVVTGSALAQGTPPPPTQGGFGGGGQGGFGGPGGQGAPGGRRMGPNNIVAKVSIDDAIKTATGKVSGYVNNAVLRPNGPPGPDQKIVWVIHVVTTPGSIPPPNGGSGIAPPGKGEDVAVDGTTGAITEMPPPPRFGGGGGGQGGGFGGGGGGRGGQGGGPGGGAGGAGGQGGNGGGAGGAGGQGGGAGGGGNGGGAGGNGANGQGGGAGSGRA